DRSSSTTWLSRARYGARTRRWRRRPSRSRCKARRPPWNDGRRESKRSPSGSVQERGDDLAQPRRAHLRDRAHLDLPDALETDAEPLRDLGERVLRLAADPEAQLDDEPLAVRQLRESLFESGFERDVLERGRVRALVVVEREHVAETGRVFRVADRRI